jgi:hypothetical protein
LAEIVISTSAKKQVIKNRNVCGNFVATRLEENALKIASQHLTKAGRL